jgi:hypothetical protein
MHRVPSLLLLAACAADPGGDPKGVDDPRTPHPFDTRLISLGDAGDTDGHDCVYDEATCPTSCDGNTAPVLGEPVVVVDGWVDVDRIDAGATVQLAFPFSDAEDNLRCGFEAHGYTDPEDQSEGFGMGSLCSNFPASDDAAGGWLGWTWVVGTPGTISAQFRVEDACGLSSDRWAWSAVVPTPDGEGIPAPTREDASQWNDRTPEE